MSYTIEKNVKMPTLSETLKVAAAKRRTKYPFAKMAKGDSFQFSEKRKKHVVAAAHNYASNHDVRFAVRGNRVWRTA